MTGWLNFDSSPTLVFQRIPFVTRALGGVKFDSAVRRGNVARGLPLRDGSCRLIYSSHVLEHLSLHDLRKSLRETHRLLEPAGVFRLVVPDLEFEIACYLKSESKDRSHAFLRSTGLFACMRSRIAAEQPSQPMVAWCLGTMTDTLACRLLPRD